MSGTCFKYKGKLVLWDSGLGDPWYVYTIFPKGSRYKNGLINFKKGIKFGYNDDSQNEKILDKVKAYINKNLDKLMDCGIDKKKDYFGCVCTADCEITKNEKNNER